MTVFCRLSCSFLLVFCLLNGFAPLSQAAETLASVEQLQQENQRLHLQLREARRELARVKAADAAPGWEQVAAGLGVIFGFSGLVMMVNARRRQS